MMFLNIVKSKTFWCCLTTAIGGSIATAILCKKKRKQPKLHAVGTLRIDHSDPLDPANLFLELEEPLESFWNQKYIVLRLSHISYLESETDDSMVA